jgi:hypothetical protein
VRTIVNALAQISQKFVAVHVGHVLHLFSLSR